MVERFQPTPKNQNTSICVVSSSDSFDFFFLHFIYFENCVSDSIEWISFTYIFHALFMWRDHFELDWKQFGKFVLRNCTPILTSCCCSFLDTNCFSVILFCFQKFQTEFRLRGAHGTRTNAAYAHWVCVWESVIVPCDEWERMQASSVSLSSVTSIIN